VSRIVSSFTLISDLRKAIVDSSDLLALSESLCRLLYKGIADVSGACIAVRGISPDSSTLRYSVGDCSCNSLMKVHCLLDSEPHSSLEKLRWFVDSRDCQDGNSKELHDQANNEAVFHGSIYNEKGLETSVALSSSHQKYFDGHTLSVIKELCYIASLGISTLVTPVSPTIYLSDRSTEAMLTHLDYASIALVIVDEVGDVIFTNQFAQQLNGHHPTAHLYDMIPEPMCRSLKLLDLTEGSKANNTKTPLELVKTWWGEKGKVRSLRFSVKKVMDRNLTDKELMVITVADTSLLTTLKHRHDHITSLILEGADWAHIGLTIERSINKRRHFGALSKEVDLDEVYRFMSLSESPNPDQKRRDASTHETTLSYKDHSLTIWASFSDANKPLPLRGVVLATTEEHRLHSNLTAAISKSEIQLSFANLCATAVSQEELDDGFLTVVQSISPDLSTELVSLGPGERNGFAGGKESLTLSPGSLEIIKSSIRRLSLGHFHTSTSSNKQNPPTTEISVLVVPRDPELGSNKEQVSAFLIHQRGHFAQETMAQISKAAYLYLNAQRRFVTARLQKRLGETDPTTKLRVARALYDVMDETMLFAPKGLCKSHLIIVTLHDADKIQQDFGFDIFEKILEQLAQLLLKVSANHEVFRVGQSQLACWLPRVSSALCKDVLRALSNARRFETEIDSIEFSIGYSASLTRCDLTLTPKQNLSKALLDNLKSKNTSHRSYRRATPIPPAESMSEVERVVSALSSNRFELHFQPKMRILDRVITSFEALLRMPLNSESPAPTQRIIEILESLGLIDELTRKVLIEAKKMLAALRVDNPEVTIAVNISPSTLSSTKWLDPVAHLLHTSRPLDGIIFEITESVELTTSKNLLSAVRELGDLGAVFSMDDFGTGFTSLMQLRTIPLAELKIDKSFIERVQGSKRSRVLVKTQVDIAHSLGVLAVAEGVELPEQLNFLSEMGCDLAQGYLIARPLAGQSVGTWCSKYLTMLQIDHDLQSSDLCAPS